MTDLSELRERLEKAEGPSRELDAAICEALNLVEIEQDEIIGPHPVVKLPGKTYCTAAPLTSSLDAAVALVEQVLLGARYSVGNNDRGRPVGQVIWNKKWEAHEAPNAALALCIALVRAMETDDDRG